MDDVTIKNERKLLKRLNKISDHYADRMIPISQIENGFDNYYLQRLMNKQLVFREATNTDSEGNAIYDSVRVSSKGLHFFEIDKEEIKRFLIRSIATPIVVSAATTLLTMFLTWLVKMAIG